ncbi:hydrolase [Kistimonas scapharcae]|uniref:Hydrolase n=1 Tax=Kistimonas scapharcae TaxID=1036133 RepID=A0ABP8V0U8_9GAMM
MGNSRTASDASFKPAWWLPGPHLQTLWSPLLKRQPMPPRTREQLTLPDGDFINLDWCGHDQGQPLIILLHGLTGCSRSKYILGLQAALLAQGYQSVAMNFRGCGGEVNHHTKGYHSGISEDLDAVTTQLAARYPSRPLAAAGFSLGGNVLLKYLGEQRAATPLTCAVAVSVPFELSRSSERINLGFSRAYRNRLLRDMMSYITRKKQHFHQQQRHEQFETLEALGDVESIKTFQAFDHRFTAPLHGFESGEAYYHRCSSRQFLPSIQIPTLIIHAKDDPFVFASSIPDKAELSGSTQLELSPRGGHVGFVTGSPLKPRYWLEERIPAWLNEQLSHQTIMRHL